MERTIETLCDGDLADRLLDLRTGRSGALYAPADRDAILTEAAERLRGTAVAIRRQTEADLERAYSRIQELERENTRLNSQVNELTFG